LAVLPGPALLSAESLRLSENKVFSGQVLVAHISLMPGAQVTGLWVYGKELDFFSEGAGNELNFVAYIPAGLQRKTGHYAVQLSYQLADNTMIEKKAFEIAPKEFQKQFVKLNTQKQKSLLRSPHLQTESNILGQIFKKKNPSRFYSGQFISPVSGDISSPFGAQRVYDDGSMGWQHKGVDMAAPLGAEVMAANAGVVSLAEVMEVHGLTVVLDHGHGIFTIYNHLSKILVALGSQVAKGQALGQLGMSGLATGPHLHFGLSVGNERVDPLQWREKAPL
jgi:murein DD-endopeptidase MepM/ murein hydrolase activator NlpD